MDKKRSLLNVTVAVSTKIILLILSLLARRFLIRYGGNTYNGLDSLYTSIIGFLAVADLGVGTAINFCMYKPIVQGEHQKVAALYQLYRKIYLVIGGVVLAVGFALTPALPLLAKDYDGGASLPVTFLLTLLATVCSYLYSCRTALINAYKNNYVTTLFYSLGSVVRYSLQITVVVVTGSFTWYCAALLAGMAVEWVLTVSYTRRVYRQIIQTKAKIDAETRREVVQKTQAMFMHKIGGVLVNTLDSVIISAFIGVVLLGKYTNYQTIMASMTAVLGLFFSPLTAIIGHMCAEGDREAEQKYFRLMYFFNFTLGIVFFLGYYAIIDDMVTICFGHNLLLDKSVSLIITINYFIQFMRQTVLLFRDATGTFYYDRWKPLFEGLLNLGLSILFVWWFGVVGVIVATIITNLLICHVVEPFVLYRHGFQSKVRRYYGLNYGLMVVFLGALAVTHFAHLTISNVWLSLLANGCVAVGIAGVVLLIMTGVSKKFREFVGSGLRMVRRGWHPRQQTPEQASQPTDEAAGASTESAPN